MSSSKRNWKSFGNKEESNKYECFYCGERLNDWNRTTDHIVPKSKGGILSNDNKVYSCRRCNQLKGDHDPETFLGMVKFICKELNATHEEKVSYYTRVISRTGKMIREAKKNEEGTKDTKHSSQ